MHVLQAQLRLLSSVKDVHPEQQVRRSLTWDSTHNQTDSEWVQKRPGRYTPQTLHLNLNLWPCTYVWSWL